LAIGIQFIPTPMQDQHILGEFLDALQQEQASQKIQPKMRIGCAILVQQ
jgi:hypothetical protein